MPTKGAVEMFVLLADFSDYPHGDALNATASVEARIFGDGESPAGVPHESLGNYYRRASYNQLDLGGSVLGWYRPSCTRASMAQTTVGREGLIKETLTAFAGQGHDFSVYDKHGNCTLDYFAVVWTGRNKGWSGF